MIVGLINLIIAAVVIALVGGLIYYVIDFIPVPEPFNRWIKMGVVVICVLLLILLLLQLLGVATTVRFPTVITYELGAAFSSLAT